MSVRIVLLGKTGAGKSATANTILGENVFKEGHFSTSTTKRSGKQVGKVDGRDILVIDTPGVYHMSIKERDVKAEIKQSLEMSAPGPHVFLLVIKLGRFTKEEKEAVKLIQKNLGEEAKRFTILLFTGADKLTKSLEEFLKENEDLQKLVDEYDGRYHAFNNLKRNDRAQVTELLKKIDAIVAKNEDKYYTSERILMKTWKMLTPKVFIIAAISGFACFLLCKMGCHHHLGPYYDHICNYLMYFLSDVF